MFFSRHLDSLLELASSKLKDNPGHAVRRAKPAKSIIQ